MSKIRFVATLALAAAVTGAALAQDPMQDPEVRARAQAMMTSGYLGRDNLPNSLLLNPAPPGQATVASIRDEEAAGAAVALRGTPRWAQAAVDADLFTDRATDTFSCAAGFAIDPQAMPKLVNLMRRSAADFGLSVYPTKNQYKRQRPFMVNGEPTCTPDQEAMLRRDGSYPSGHSAIGYGWGLLLAEIVPNRTAELVARGRAFGDSRRVCNVHWLSDVEEGRVVATAVFAKLQADKNFQKDLKAARAEVAKKAAKLPQPDCARETAALAGQ